MRSGLYLTCGLILLGGCAHSTGFQSVGHAGPKPLKATVGKASTKPIQLVAYPPSRPPHAEPGYGNPWQSVSPGQAKSDSIQSMAFESEETPRQPPPFQNSGPQIRRVNKPVMGHSSPPGTVDSNARISDYASFSAAAPLRNGPSQNWNTVEAESSDYERPSGVDPTILFEQSRRNVINPPDWNPAAAVDPQFRTQGFTSDSAGSMSKPQGFSGPTIRGFSQPIQQAGHSEFSVTSGPSEIPLRPGQTLPGFTNQRPRIAQIAERESPRVIPHVPSGVQNGDRVRQSRSEALKFLTTATEREIAGLSPAQTATELQYYIERHVYLRLLYLMAGQTEWALRPIPNIPAADQEFWTQVLWGVHSYFDMHQVPNPTERAAQTIAQFNTAILRLKERAPLELKKVVFSNKIFGFGEFETYSQDEFAPGERVLVYAEIGNFHSELTAEGIYRTRLKSALQFYSADNPDEPIESKTYPVTEDFCRNHRHDYFHSYVVDIPARCGKGRHLLKLIIEDELSGKTAEFPVEFGVR